MSKTRADLREYARWRLDQHGTSYLKTSDATQFDMDEALQEGYRKYAILTKCFMVQYTRAAVVNSHTYHYGAFGVQVADTDAIAVDVTAAPIPPVALTIAAQPSQYSPITVSLTGTAPEPNGVLTTYTIVGTGRGLMALTDTVIFTAAQLLALGTGTLTRQTTQYFTSVTSITPSASQPTGWKHKAGVPALSSGDRIFDITHVAYDERPLMRVNRHDLDLINAEWRFADSGTPGYFLPWGSRQLRIYRPPSGTDNLVVEGWEIPDSTTFAADTHVPDVPDEDAFLIPLWPCILATTKNPNDENDLKANLFYKEWETGISRAYERIHGTGDEEIIFARYAAVPEGEWPPITDTITTI